MNVLKKRLLKTLQSSSNEGHPVCIFAFLRYDVAIGTVQVLPWIARRPDLPGTHGQVPCGATELGHR